MGTVDNPDVYIQYYDTSWHELISKSRSFETRDAGVLKVPVANVALVNPASLPSLYNKLRIFVDVDGIDRLSFYGHIFQIERIPMPGTINKNVYGLSAKGIEQRLLRDFITWEFQEEQDSRAPETAWTYEEMIDDQTSGHEGFLKLPDSGYDTNIRLETDTNEILNAINGNFNFSQQTLMDALRAVAETIGYDGYVYVDDSENAKLLFKKLGTIAASPATTITDPCIKAIKTIDMTKIKNYIFVWGGAEIGWPTDQDKFTERGYAKYTPKIWEAIDHISSIVDYQYGAGETPENTPHTSYYCIKAVQSGGAGANMKLRFRVDRAGISSLDMLERYKSITFALKPLYGGAFDYTYRCYLHLWDINGKTIKWQTWGGEHQHKRNKWAWINMGTPLFSDEISSKTSKVNCWVGWALLCFQTKFLLKQVK